MEVAACGFIQPEIIALQQANIGEMEVLHSSLKIRPISYEILG